MSICLPVRVLTLVRFWGSEAQGTLIKWLKSSHIWFGFVPVCF